MSLGYWFFSRRKSDAMRFAWESDQPLKLLLRSGLSWKLSALMEFGMLFAKRSPHEPTDLAVYSYTLEHAIFHLWRNSTLIKQR